MADDDVSLLDLIGLESARQSMLGRRGKPPTVETVRWWIRDGYAPVGWVGERLRLKAIRTSTDLLTHPSWVAAFERGRARMGMGLPPNG